MTLQDSNDIISVSKGLRYNYPLKIQYGYPVVSQLHDSTRKPEGQSLRLFFYRPLNWCGVRRFCRLGRKHAAQSKSLKQNFLVLRSLGAQKILKKLVRPNCKPRKGGAKLKFCLVCGLSISNLTVFKSLGAIRQQINHPPAPPILAGRARKSPAQFLSGYLISHCVDHCYCWIAVIHHFLQFFQVFSVSCLLHSPNFSSRMSRNHKVSCSQNLPCT